MPARSGALPLFIAFALAAVTFALYWPVHGFDFLNYDDPEYFTANPHVLGGLTWDGVKWAFSGGGFRMWHPLTWLSLMLDATLFGRGATGPHMVNALLHSANAALVFALVRRMTGAMWRSAMVAALFALHPLRVESVAWVCERKDVLSGFFGLCALLAYARHGQRSEVRSQKAGLRPLASDLWPLTSGFYLLSLCCFTLGLMSKPMLVTLPLLMLLLDVWPLGRVSGFGSGVSGRQSGGGFSVSAFQRFSSRSRFIGVQLFLEKIPFFILSAAMAAATVLLHRKDGVVSELSLMARVENSVVAVAAYLGRTFWPERLAIFYPHPGHWPFWQVAAGVAILIVISVVTILAARKFPFGLFGWSWFLVALLPVIGLVQAGDQAWADRFTYFPSIGLGIALVWAVAEIVSRWKIPRAAVAGFAVLVLGVCAARTIDQLRHWRDSESIFRHALAVTQNNAVAHNNLGACLAENGRWDEALEQYQLALRVKPGYAEALDNVAAALMAKGDAAGAEAQSRAALELRPGRAETRFNLGLAFAAQGRRGESIAQYRLAVKSDPGHVRARNNLAGQLAALGRLDDAVAEYEAALRLEPESGEVCFNLGVTLSRLGRRGEAARFLREALRLMPGDAEAMKELRALGVER